ncbi:MAG: acetate kinase, partial [Eubacteriales bacterium]|nr:acetate kinase [Eubacteriales bacterium]
SPLAPLHNPAAVLAIRACQKVFGKEVPMVAVFDTAFHQTMPAKADMYGLPYEDYEKYSIRKYGFHGTSHRFVSADFAKRIGKPLSELKMVTCHLGNGSSITAVDCGKSVDTTMGFTPLDGVLMGTRSGSIDASAVLYLMDKTGMTAKEMDTYMNKKSGMLGISGISSDFRDLGAAAEKGDERAKLALDMFVYAVKKYIGSYAAALNGADAIVFTAGVGENDREVRADILKDMEYMGIVADFDYNMTCPRGEEVCISKPESKVKIFVIPTDEEMTIARDTARLVAK